MEIEFGLALLTIDTKFTEISPCIVFLPAILDEVDGGKDQGRCCHMCPNREPFSIWCRIHPSPFPADMEIKPGRGQEDTFHLPTSASLRLAVL